MLSYQVREKPTLTTRTGLTSLMTDLQLLENCIRKCSFASYSYGFIKTHRALQIF